MKDRCLLWLPFRRCCLHGSFRGIWFWLPIQMSKISSMKPKASLLIWPAIHLLLERIPKLKILLFGNMNYVEATIILPSYVRNQFWGTSKLKQSLEDGRIMNVPPLLHLKNYPKRKRRTRNRKTEIPSLIKLEDICNHKLQYMKTESRWRKVKWHSRVKVNQTWRSSEGDID